MVIWLVGLSGTGKTTIGCKMYDFWKDKEPNTVMLDGDDVRRMFGQDRCEFDYTIEGRRVNAMRIIEICSWLDRQGINVVCCILCIFNDLMLANKKRFSSYFQVFLDAPLETLRKRDPKGLYRRADNGQEKNVMGIDLKFTPPSASDLSISTDWDAPEPVALAQNILRSAGILI